MNNTAEILVGVSASGKSTYANDKVRNDKNWIKLDRDDLRFSLTGARDWREYRFDKRVEKLITEIHILAAREAFGKKNIIMAETNLTRKNRDFWIEYLSELGYNVFIKEFPIEIEDAIMRDRLRQYSVGDACIRKQYAQWLTYLEEKNNALH